MRTEDIVGQEGDSRGRPGHGDAVEGSALEGGKRHVEECGAAAAAAE